MGNEKQIQKSPRAVRLYPPVEKAWDALKMEQEEDNFNFYVNYCLAEKLGLQIDLTIYRRPSKNETTTD